MTKQPTMTLTRPTVLSLPEEMLERFRARAGDLDRENSYFSEDLAELRDFGYLGAVVPREHGGWGLTLAEFAVATAVLLTGIIGAVAAGIGDANNITQSDAEREAGTIGLTAAAVLVAVLLIGYYAGGYVAGRMSRFDGGRQGMVVWVIGLIVTVVAVAVGWVLGDQYNVLDRVDLPRIPIPTDELTTGGVITGIVAVLGTLLAAMAGGKVGRHYHDRVDRAAYPNEPTI